MFGVAGGVGGKGNGGGRAEAEAVATVDGTTGGVIVSGDGLGGANGVLLGEVWSSCDADHVRCERDGAGPCP